MIFLSVIFFLVAIVTSIFIKEEIDPSSELVKYRRKQLNQTPDKKKIIKCVCVLLLSLVLMVVCFAAGCEDDSGGNSWDNLSKEEKQWYKDNYGNGKSEQYDQALKDYRGW